MIGKKLVKILQTLDPAAFRHLGNAVASPYFTSSPLLLKLYALLKKEYPEFNTEKLTKENIFKTLYPGKPFNDGALRVLVREFTKVTEDFVLFEALRNNEYARQQALVQWYGTNNLYTEFEKGSAALLADLDQTPFRDVEHFSAAATLQTSYFFHPFTQKHTLDDGTLMQLMANVDQHYILLKLRLASEMKNRERILSRKYDLLLMDEILTTGETGPIQANHTYQLYRLLLSLYGEGQNDDTFFQLKSLFIKVIDRIRFFDRSMIITQLINYAIQQLNRGITAFNKEVFDLYRLALVQNLVLVNGKIEAHVLQNIVLSGCKEDELEWTEQFIHNFAPLLEKSIAEDCKTMSLALVNYHKKDYDKAITLITNHHFFDVLLQLSTRVILIKVWFEKFLQHPQHFEHLLFQLDANEKFVRRNNVISTLKKEENLHFLQATRQLAHFILEKKPASEVRSRLEKYTDNSLRVVSRDWLRQKTHDYERKN